MPYEIDTFDGSDAPSSFVVASPIVVPPSPLVASSGLGVSASCAPRGFVDASPSAGPPRFTTPASSSPHADRPSTTATTPAPRAIDQVYEAAVADVGPRDSAVSLGALGTP